MCFYVHAQGAVNLKIVNAGGVQSDTFAVTKPTGSVLQLSALQPNSEFYYLGQKGFSQAPRAGYTYAGHAFGDSYFGACPPLAQAQPGPASFALGQEVVLVCFYNVKDGAPASGGTLTLKKMWVDATFPTTQVKAVVDGGAPVSFSSASPATVNVTLGLHTVVEDVIGVNTHSYWGYALVAGKDAACPADRTDTKTTITVDNTAVQPDWTVCIYNHARATLAFRAVILGGPGQGPFAVRLFATGLDMGVKQVGPSWTYHSLVLADWTITDTLQPSPYYRIGYAEVANGGVCPLEPAQGNFPDPDFALTLPGQQRSFCLYYEFQRGYLDIAKVNLGGPATDAFKADIRFHQQDIVFSEAQTARVELVHETYAVTEEPKAGYQQLGWAVVPGGVDPCPLTPQGSGPVSVAVERRGAISKVCFYNLKLGGPGGNPGGNPGGTPVIPGTFPDPGVTPIPTNTPPPTTTPGASTPTGNPQATATPEKPQGTPTPGTSTGGSTGTPATSDPTTSTGTVSPDEPASTTGNAGTTVPRPPDAGTGRGRGSQGSTLLIVMAALLALSGPAIAVAAMQARR